MGVSDTINIMVTLAGAQQAAAQLKSIETNVRGLSTSQQQSAQAATQMTSGFRNLISAGSVFIGLGLVRSIANIGAECVRAAAQMEDWSVQFEVLYGNAATAHRIIQDLEQYANRTPFEMPGLVDAANLLANFGISADGLMPTIDMLSNVAAGSQEKLMGLARAFGQMSTAGRLMGQDLNQMINAGFNPLQEMSRTTGRSMAELRTAMERGQISVQQVTEAFRTATAEGGRFYNMNYRMSQTFNGQMSTLMDNVHRVQRSIGEGLLPSLRDVVRNLNNVASANNADAWRRLGQGISFIARAVLSVPLDTLRLLSLFQGVSPEEMANTFTRGAGALGFTPVQGAGGGGGGGAGGGGAGGGGAARPVRAGADAEAIVGGGSSGENTLQGIFHMFNPEAQQEQLDSYQEHAMGIVKVTETMASGISDIMNQVSVNEKMRLENDYKGKKKWIMQNVTDETERKKQLAALDEWYDAEQGKMAKKQAERQKALMLMQAIVNTAMGITSALAMSGPPWVGIAMAAIVGALGAAQIALIASQPIPEAAEGAFIRGSSGGTIMRVGERGRSEAVIPLENDEAMDRLGGMGGTTININANNLFADDDTAKKLAKMIDKELFTMKRNRNSMAFA